MKFFVLRFIYRPFSVAKHPNFLNVEMLLGVPLAVTEQTVTPTFCYSRVIEISLACVLAPILFIKK